MSGSMLAPDSSYNNFGEMQYDQPNMAFNGAPPAQFQNANRMANSNNSKQSILPGGLKKTQIPAQQTPFVNQMNDDPFADLDFGGNCLCFIQI